jgi:hypothetical protein
MQDKRTADALALALAEALHSLVAELVREELKRRVPQREPVTDEPPYLSRRAAVLHHRRPHPRATVVRRRGPLRVPPARRSGGGQASVRAAPAAPCARAGARPRGRPAQHHPAPTRAHQPRHDVDLPPRDRPRGDHRHRPDTPRADDVGQCRTAALIESPATMSGSARRAPAPPWRSERRNGPTHTTEPRPRQASRRR